MDINKKLDEALKNLASNPAQKKYIENMAHSRDGIKIKNSLSEAEKQRIITKFLQLDPQQVKRALSQGGSSKLAGMSTDEIIRRLKQL